MTKQLESKVEAQLAAIRRGTAEIIPESELARKIGKSLVSGRPLRVKYGIDPTAPELHLGHSVPIRKLRDFQELGHQVIFLVGDFTALVGDPTGRTETRPMLSAEEIRENIATYRDQALRILDGEKTRFVYNSEWLAGLDFGRLLKISACFTVAQMLEREDFSRRYREGSGISLQEFLYPLMQGYDSVALEADVEIGATEQKFNLLAGRTIQESHGQEKQVVITLPVLEGTDGIRKMSKSYGNVIPLLLPPAEMFGRLMSIPDSLTEKYLRCLTGAGDPEVPRIMAGHPREAKAEMARRVTALYHGPEAAAAASAEFDRVFREREAPGDDALETPPVFFDDPFGLPEILGYLAGEGGFSRTEIKRMIQQGAIRVNGERVTRVDQPLPPAGTYLVRVGRHRFYRWQKKRGET